MSPTLSAYIIKYGYIALFSLVFLQEIGVPNNVPNELVLLFSGYLTGVKKNSI
jgi:membrane protein DedA with SNARE-associated domain